MVRYGGFPATLPVELAAEFAENGILVLLLLVHVPFIPRLLFAVPVSEPPNARTPVDRALRCISIERMTLT